METKIVDAFKMLLQQTYVYVADCGLERDSMMPDVQTYSDVPRISEEFAEAINTAREVLTELLGEDVIAANVIGIYPGLNPKALEERLQYEKERR